MKKRGFSVRPHPYSFYTYLSKILYLLIIPLIQQLIFRPESLFQKIGTTIINFSFLFLITGIAIAHYRSIYYRQNNIFITFKKGFFIKKRLNLPINTISTLYMQSNILSGTFGASKLYINSNALKDKKGVTFIASRKKCQKISERLTGTQNGEEIYKCSFFNVIILALTGSNSVTGLLVISPFIDRIGTVLGREYSDRLYSAVDLTDYFMIFGLPPALAYIAGILFAGYVLAVVIKTLRYLNFKVIKRGDTIIIPKGIGIKSLFLTQKKNITAISVRQSLLMILLKIYTVSLHTLNSAKAKGDDNLIVPLTGCDGAIKFFKSINNRCNDYKVIVRPLKKRLKNYLYFPFSVFLVIIFITVLMVYNHFYNSFINIFLLFFIPFTFVLAGFRIIAHKHCGIFICENQIKVQSFKKLNIITTVIPTENIEYTAVKRNPAQRFFGTCNVIISIRSTGKRRFKVRNLEYEEVKKFIFKI